MFRPSPIEYKGYRIELTPGGDYCAAFAIDIRDQEGHLLSHLGTAGNTEQRAVDRGKEWIDFELAYTPAHEHPFSTSRPMRKSASR